MFVFVLIKRFSFLDFDFGKSKGLSEQESESACAEKNLK